MSKGESHTAAEIAEVWISYHLWSATQDAVSHRMRFTCIVAMSLSFVGCGGSSTSPSRFGVITTIRYERVYQTSGDTGVRMLINVSLPAHKNIPFCFPVQQSATTFVCESLNWQIDEGEDATVWVEDPAVSHPAARRIFINGKELTRIDAFANGVESARLNWTASGGFQ